MLIRRATPADASALAHMRYAFRSNLGTAIEDESAFVARAREWFASRIASPNGWFFWVAEDGGEIIGHACLNLVEKVPNPVDEGESIGYITNVYVRPERRGQGTGAVLLGQTVAYCREQGVDWMILWPTPLSVGLYLRAGFTPAATLLEQPIRR